MTSLKFIGKRLLNSPWGRNPTHSPLSINIVSTRGFYAWLNSIFNRVDPNRIKEVGPDRACAEWLIRCGASVKWVNSQKFMKDYNSLPVGGGPMFKIEEVDATDAAIMEIGFPHFKNCAYLRKIKLKNCGYIEDASMRSIAYLLHEHLSWLEVIQCHNISDEGLLALHKMKALKVLHLENLSNVKNPQEVIASLSDCLPKCQISYPPFTTESEEEID